MPKRNMSYMSCHHGPPGEKGVPGMFGMHTDQRTCNCTGALVPIFKCAVTSAIRTVHARLVNSDRIDKNMPRGPSGYPGPPGFSTCEAFKFVCCLNIVDAEECPFVYDLVSVVRNTSTAIADYNVCPKSLEGPMGPMGERGPSIFDSQECPKYIST
jgi:hypothetical protein